MKLSKAISWLLRGLQQVLFPQLEECWHSPLTDKEQQLISILELVQIERFVPRSASTQRLGRKLSDRESIARSFVAKAVYGYPFTRSLIEALNLHLARGEKKRRRSADFAFRSPLNLVGFWLIEGRNLSEEQGTWEV